MGGGGSRLPDGRERGESFPASGLFGQTYGAVRGDLGHRLIRRRGETAAHDSKLVSKRSQNAEVVTMISFEEFGGAPPF